jgi:energy-coupling factor transport system permease protein
MLAVMAVINPLFNHEGMNILWQLPSGNPITVESVIYGLCAAIMILSVILHFSCYNEVMTSDKFIYLFGKTMPSLSLIISMTFRFVPRFASQLKVVSDAQKCLGRDMRSGGVIMRARSGLNILSIMMTWSLENAIETADSMKSRGYGNSGRTTFSMYKFDKRDKKALIIVVLLGIYIFIGSLMGKMSFTYFPVIKFTKVSLSSISVFVAYLLLCIYPVIIEIREVIRWKALKLKI